MTFSCLSRQFAKLPLKTFNHFSLGGEEEEDFLPLSSLARGKRRKSGKRGEKRRRALPRDPERETSSLASLAFSPFSLFLTHASTVPEGEPARKVMKAAKATTLKRKATMKMTETSTFFLFISAFSLFCPFFVEASSYLNQALRQKRQGERDTEIRPNQLILTKNINPETYKVCVFPLGFTLTSVSFCGFLKGTILILLMIYIAFRILKRLLIKFAVLLGIA